MPEVVYPSNDETGKPRAWNTMFPELPDSHDAWQVINNTLESIAMNNRFGDKTPDQLREHLVKYGQEFTQDRLREMGSFDEAKFDKIMIAHGLYNYYTNYVFDNLGGAYREYKK